MTHGKMRALVLTTTCGFKSVLFRGNNVLQKAFGTNIGVNCLRWLLLRDW